MKYDNNLRQCSSLNRKQEGITATLIWLRPLPQCRGIVQDSMQIVPVQLGVRVVALDLDVRLPASREWEFLPVRKRPNAT